MTVTSIIGSSLDDVWGTEFNKKKRKSKKTSDPFCKIPSRYDDIMDVYYPNEENYEKFDKTNYSRTMHPQEDTDAEERVTKDTHIKVKPPKETFSELKSYFEKHKLKLVPKDEKEKQYMDLALYIFSGIVLIFILEQFVNIGIVLGNRLY
jgi:hypothetical protein